MHLLPREQDKLLLTQAGFLAQRRLARGVRLNHGEATALIASVLQEHIRDGKNNVADLMQLGKTFLGRCHVLEGVPEMLHEVMVEGTFPDGSFLVTVHDPICTPTGDAAAALYGSFLPTPDPSLFPEPKVLQHLPGALIVADAPPIELCPTRDRITLRVTNTGDRPIQVGSHYPFVETNAALSFPRLAAIGRRLDIAAGTAVRFEPGDVRSVNLVRVGGAQMLALAGNGIAAGFVRDLVSPAEQENIAARLVQMGFANEPVPQPLTIAPTARLTREAYAALYGPTTGDLLRLGDSDLWLRVEKDMTSYGDECKFGGGKVLRDGMGQATGRNDAETLDTVIINALIVDWWGIIKADIGIKAGIIVGIGKAGNPDIMDGVTAGMIVGSCTEVIAGDKLILTAGAIDAHVHYICPGLCEEALATGVTTLLGGGTGPSAGTSATTCTPGLDNLRFMLRATDDIPLNFAFTGKGNDSGAPGLEDQIKAGCVGLKIHEDWGATPAVIDSCLTVCDKYDVQCNIHTDTLNESCFVEGTIAAFKDRTIHTYHSEGAGGGHAPDICIVCSLPNVLPSSTNPTRPYTINTLDEAIDMMCVCHHLDRNITEDVAFADSRIRAETMAAEDVLQDSGAISIISSDSQAMGRIGEVVSRTWRTAGKMKEYRGQLQEDVGLEEAYYAASAGSSSSGSRKRAHTPGGAGDIGPTADNFRIKRYVAKYTINPAIVHGMSHIIGSVEVGKLADLVLYRPENFGVKPEVVIKGGNIAWAQMGDANASIPTVQPVIGRPMYGAKPGAAPTNSISFVSSISLAPTLPDGGSIISSYGLRKRCEAVRGCRGIGKKDMKLNDALPKITVDPETYVVEADGVVCTVEPAKKLPLTQSLHFY